MKETRLDFCGFRWKGIHSSTFGIWRVSEGSRYSETLLPAFQDETVKMPGQDGTLYWKSSYTNKQFSINIAFDKLTEKQLRELRAFFSAKERGELIFDEAPYKAYTVKVQNPPQLKTICFDEKGQRVYKGEGTLSFVAYYPFARAPMKFLNEYEKEKIENIEEWKRASGLLNSSSDLTAPEYKPETPDSQGKITFSLYNPGDLETDFKLVIPFPVKEGNLSPFNRGIVLTLSNNNSMLASFALGKDVIPKTNDIKLQINSATQLIEGIGRDGQLSGNLYNEYISSGNFFKIPINSFNYEIEKETKETENGDVVEIETEIMRHSETSLTISGTSDQGCTIKYDYLYY